MTELFRFEYRLSGDDRLELVPIAGRAYFADVREAWAVHVAQHGLPEAGARFDLVEGVLVPVAAE